MIVLTGYCHNCNKDYAHYATDRYDETYRHTCERKGKNNG